MSQPRGGGFFPKHFSAFLPFRWQMLKNYRFDNHVVYMDDQLIISCINIQIIWYCELKTPSENSLGHSRTQSTEYLHTEVSLQVKGGFPFFCLVYLLSALPISHNHICTNTNTRIYKRHVLKPGTTGTKPPEQPERNHRNNRNDRNKNRKRPEPPKPKSNTEFHLLDLPTCISRAILRIYVIVNS